MPKPDAFSWVIPDVLAATARPWNTRLEIEFFKDAGIDVIITLMERPLAQPLIEEFGFEYHHFPIRDFSAPTQKQIKEFVKAVDSAREAGKKVVVHCLAGHGRTGTMIACYLVSRGRSSNQAIAETRDLRPGSIETYSQERAIHQYARSLRKKGK